MQTYDPMSLSAVGVLDDISMKCLGDWVFCNGVLGCLVVYIHVIYSTCTVHIVQ